MQNFNYYNPVKVIFGKDTIQQLSELISLNRRILMPYGGGFIIKNGVYAKVKKALEKFP
jgi:NADP-dependent alcohol dehydrogenase